MTSHIRPSYCNSAWSYTSNLTQPVTFNRTETGTSIPSEAEEYSRTGIYI